MLLMKPNLPGFPNYFGSTFSLFESCCIPAFYTERLSSTTRLLGNRIAVGKDGFQTFGLLQNSDIRDQRYNVLFEENV